MTDYEAEDPSTVTTSTDLAAARVNDDGEFTDWL